MKFKTTHKQIKENYRLVVAFGYCDLQDELRVAGLCPIAYTSGIYGWNADVYDLGNGLAVVTGYRPFGSRSEIDRDIVRRRLAYLGEKNEKN